MPYNPAFAGGFPPSATKVLTDTLSATSIPKSQQALDTFERLCCDMSSKLSGKFDPLGCAAHRGISIHQADANGWYWHSDDLNAGDHAATLDEARAQIDAAMEGNAFIRCNRCGVIWDEDALVATLDAEDGEPSRACPTCRTDNFLMDLGPEGAA